MTGPETMIWLTISVVFVTFWGGMAWMVGTIIENRRKRKAEYHEP